MGRGGPKSLITPALRVSRCTWNLVNCRLIGATALGMHRRTFSGRTSGAVILLPAVVRGMRRRSALARLRIGRVPRAGRPLLQYLHFPHLLLSYFVVVVLRSAATAVRPPCKSSTTIEYTRCTWRARNSYYARNYRRSHTPIASRNIPLFVPTNTFGRGSRADVKTLFFIFYAQTYLGLSLLLLLTVLRDAPTGRTLCTLSSDLRTKIGSYCFCSECLAFALPTEQYTSTFLALMLRPNSYAPQNVIARMVNVVE